MARGKNTYTTSDPRLRELTIAMCNGTITKSELAQLEQRLERDESARQFYLYHLSIHGNLVARYRGAGRSATRQQLFAGDVGDADIRERSGRTAARSVWGGVRRLLGQPLWATTAIVLIALGVFYWMRVAPDDPRPDVAKPDSETRTPQRLDSDTPEKGLLEVAGEELATLHSTGAVRWTHTGAAVETGARVAANRSVDVGDGACELVLNDGVRVVVEGPARWKFAAQNEFVLSSGKVYVDGPPGMTGFTVRTPNSRIIDLGTEFVVDATTAGETDVAVLSGVVDCFKLNADETISDRTQIVAGEAAKIALDAKMLISIQSPEDVVCRHNLEMPEAVTTRWRFEEAVPPPPDAELLPIRGAISDSSGHGHRLDYWPGGKDGIGPYRFSKDVPPTSMFRDGESGGSRSFDCGALHPSKPGVLNSATGHGHAEEIEKGFTLEGFFKTDGDRFRQGNMVILFQGERFNSYMVSLNTLHRGECRFGVFGAKSGETPRFISTMTPERINVSNGEWHYFVARYTSEKDETPGRLELIVVDEKGRMHSSSGKIPIGFRISTSNRPLLVGRQLYHNELQTKSHFVGKIDEIRISNRPLSDSELLGKLPTAKPNTAAQEPL